eukprot:TRINITY_DN6831_c0_g1_i1.p1 TRINITY_DN6831_c0_g1~~TRINITY_DN6831_c0_g1_i1.p1  ORF type:complete len:173 (+),score=26.31 TRINITY_DN6831_c0_g1_i1:184-702(+)
MPRRGLARDSSINSHNLMSPTGPQMRKNDGAGAGPSTPAPLAREQSIGRRNFVASTETPGAARRGVARDASIGRRSALRDEVHPTAITREPSAGGRSRLARDSSINRSSRIDSDTLQPTQSTGPRRPIDREASIARRTRVDARKKQREEEARRQRIAQRRQQMKSINIDNAM